jgi:membrane protein required for colicin V production
MNGLDFAILGAFFVSTLIGAMRGFTKEILSLFSWGGSVSLSYIFLPLGRSIVQPYIANPMMADGAALFCMFIISLILLSIIANIIASYIHESSFRGVDHSLGFGFGMLRGVVFISIVELIFSTFSPRHLQSHTIQSARFVPMARKGGDTLLQLLPASLRATIIEQAVKVEHQVNSKVQENMKHALAGTGIPAGTPGEIPTGGIQSGLESTFGGGTSSGGAHTGGFFQPSPNSPAQSPSSAQVIPGMAHGVGQPAQGPSQDPAQGMMQPQQGVVVQQQNSQPVQSGMLVIRPPQPGQAPQLAPSSGPAVDPSDGSPVVTQNTMPSDGGQIVPPQPLGQAPRDSQATVDELSRLKPQSSPKEDSGYTRGQRDDMNRLFQSAGGD